MLRLIVLPPFAVFAGSYVWAFRFYCRSAHFAGVSARRAHLSQRVIFGWEDKNCGKRSPKNKRKTVKIVCLDSFLDLFSISFLFSNFKFGGKEFN